MSRNFVFNTASDLRSAEREQLGQSAEYAELLNKFFEAPSTFSIVPSGADVNARAVSDEIAAEVGASGRRVVIVSVNKLLEMNPITIPEGISFLPGNSANVWIWPSFGPQLDAPRPSVPKRQENWLDMLRRNFHTVLLDCPPLGSKPGVAEVSAMVNSTLLVTEAGKTQKQQVRNDQLALQLSGARLVGFVLVHRT